MDSQREKEVLSAFREEFHNYIDYWKLMDTIPNIEEAKVASLFRRRSKNGLSEISYFTKKNGILMVDAYEWREWVRRDFSPKTAHND